MTDDYDDDYDYCYDYDYCDLVLKQYVRIKGKSWNVGVISFDFM